MKTHVRYFEKIRVIVVCAALAALIGLEISLSESLAARVGQTAARQTDSVLVPSLGIADLMAAAR